MAESENIEELYKVLELATERVELARMELAQAGEARRDAAQALVEAGESQTTIAQGKVSYSLRVASVLATLFCCYHAGKAYMAL